MLLCDQHTPSGSLLEVVLDNVWVKHWDYCSRLNNESSYDPQAHGSVVDFPLEYSPKVNQSVEQVDCYTQLSTNVVDLKLFIKYV
jgi:hypothetical protein